MKKNITHFLITLFTLIISKSFCYALIVGNGSDGALNVSSGTTTINTVASPVAGLNGIGNTINIGSSAGFAMGDVVLVMQMDGVNAGSYDELTIASLTGTSLTFTSSTSVSYSSLATNKAQVIRIPQYTTVNVSAGATLTAPAWNGSTGGVLIYYANNTVTINGTETMDGKGFTGGSGAAGNAAGTAGTIGTGGPAAGNSGTSASGVVGGAGGGGAAGAGAGGNGGSGNTALPPTLGATGNGSGAGASGTAGTNLSTGLSSLLLGGGGGGGQGGQGGQYGGAGGGGGAASLGGAGANGAVGTTGTASAGTGGTGGTGGGIILMRVATITGTGTISSNGAIGNNGTGTGGTGGNGGNGGNGGAFLSGLALSNGGGGGGGGKAGKGGQGPGGGGGGGAGVIAVVTGTTSWAGTMSNSGGTGGTGGAGGASGTSGNGGSGGAAWLLGTAGSNGTAGAAVTAGLVGPSGGSGAAAIPPIVLPVTLINFTGIALTNFIKLEWQTTQEKNNAYFIIEKSEDGIHYTELKKVSGQIFSNRVENYSLDDTSPFAGNNYYRLKQVDVNGNLTILKVVVVNFASEVATLALYPNPVGDDRTIHLQYNSEGSKAAQVKVVLYNQVGKIVSEEVVGILNNGYTFSLSQNIAAGIYYLNVLSDTINNKSEKLVVR